MARRPRGALAAGFCSTYHFPWETVSADIKESVRPLPDDFSSFLLYPFRIMECSLVTPITARSARGDRGLQVLVFGDNFRFSVDVMVPSDNRTC